MITKTVECEPVYHISLSEEELASLNLTKNSKFDFIPQEDGSVKLEHWQTVDIGDLNEYPKEVLINLISKSLEEDITINDVIVNVLREYLNNHESGI
jgi:hypothetical protein